VEKWKARAQKRDDLLKSTQGKVKTLEEQLEQYTQFAQTQISKLAENVDAEVVEKISALSINDQIAILEKMAKPSGESKTKTRVDTHPTKSTAPEPTDGQHPYHRELAQLEAQHPAGVPYDALAALYRKHFGK